MIASVPGRLVSSPCCNPRMPLDALLAAYAAMGFVKFEVFTTWVEAQFDVARDPAHYRDVLDTHGMQATSLHLPQVLAGDPGMLDRAIAAARFAAALGARVVLYKADTIATYAATARAFLDATEHLGLTPVLQNQRGTAISTLDDVREVHRRIGDRRMKALLEVGHFHLVGVRWQDACDALGESIRLVHIKDMRGDQSVVFGTGEIELPALFSRLKDTGYTGDFVMEIEAGGGDTLDSMRQSLAYLRTIMPG